jgi:N-acetylglucosamine kinase-like BadF-type ATPase
MSQLSTFPRAQLIDSGVLEKPLMSDLQVFFYGSGCTPAHVPMMKQMLGEVFDPQKVEVHSDLMAAARALCQHEEGIACILGTGANSCLYDGNDIVQNTPALGYILGDEGSGAVLGKRFIHDLYGGILSEEIKQIFERETKLNLAEIIKRVYREPLANRFLASLSEFISAHLDDAGVRAVVVRNFEDFLRLHIKSYHRGDLPVSFVGSVAWHYQDELKEAAEHLNFHIGTILKTPMAGLIRYHSQR